MRAAPLHPDEERRLLAVHRLGLLGTGAEERYDALTELAGIVLDAPMALISLIDEHRQWVKSSVDFDIAEMPRETAFCAHAIVEQSSDPFIVEDTLVDERFADNPLVTGEKGVRFYAGQTLRSDDGMPVGTLCVLDRRPRTLDASQRRALRQVAALVEQEFSRRSERQLVHALAQSEERKGLILDNVIEGLILADSSGSFLEWNNAAEELLGVGDGGLDDTVTTPRWDTIHPDGTPWSPESRPSVVALRTRRPVMNEIVGMRRPNGEVRWMRVNARPVRTADSYARTAAEPNVSSASGGDGGGWHVLTTFYDVTAEVADADERRRLEDELRRNEVTARVSLDALEQGVVFVEAGDIRRINPAAERILGYSQSELDVLWKSNEWETYQDNGDVLAPAERPIARAAATGEIVTGQVVGWRRKDGERILVRVSVIPGSRTDGMVITFTDITEEHLARKLLDTTLEVAPVGLAILGPDGQIMRCNKTFADHAGRSPDTLIGTDVVELIEPQHRSMVATLGWSMQSGESKVVELDHRVVRPDGDEIWVNTRITTIPDRERPFAVAATFDITERFQVTEELGHRALHDPLTDLANRELLETTIDRALARAHRNETSIALCYIDLDGFKHVNDTHGHAAGDEVLVSVSDRINRSIRDGDLAARVGGDEFVVMFDGIHTPEQAFTAAGRLREQLVAPHLDAEIECGASFGLAMSTPQDTRSALLARADAAMYRAKANGQSAIELDELRAGRSADPLAPI